MIEVEKINDTGIFIFPNNGVLFKRVPPNLFGEIQKDVEIIKNSFDIQIPANKNLAGHIKNEFKFKNENLNLFLLNLTNEYNSNFSYINEVRVLSQNVYYNEPECWINFQKKMEFNPVHEHPGILSFVLWVHIPYDIENEIKNFDAVDNVTAKFQFIYSNILGRTSTYDIPVDKKYEGIICMFPSILNHCVYPFYTSNDYRISIAGNISLNPDRKVK